MNARRAPDDPVEWLNRAESSLTQASHLLDGVYLEDLCAAAHQAAEKAIKSVLLKKAVDYPYVHDLGRLLALARDSDIPFPDTVREAVRLTRYATARYPSPAEPVTREEYEVALTHARHVVEWAKLLMLVGERGSRGL
jgi:HEPN domain-containing protein